MQLRNHANAVQVDDGVLVRLAPSARSHSARLLGERSERDPGFPCMSLLDRRPTAGSGVAPDLTYEKCWDSSTYRSLLAQ